MKILRFIISRKCAQNRKIWLEPINMTFLMPCLFIAHIVKFCTFALNFVLPDPDHESEPSCEHDQTISDSQDADREGVQYDVPRDLEGQEHQVPEVVIS